MKKSIAVLMVSFTLVGCQRSTGLTNATGVAGSDSTNNSVAQSATTNPDQTMPTPQNVPVLTTEEKKITEAVIKTTLGNITVKFYKEDAPNTFANFVKLAKGAFYDGTKFHRVIKDFMIQGGDPLTTDDRNKDRWGTGGPGYTFNDEINAHKLVRGSLAMANAGPNTNGSQFFIVTATSTPWLDGHHTNFGEVVSGIDVLDKIQNTPTDSSDRPIKDVVITGIELQ